jgi:hypothetical protein
MTDIMEIVVFGILHHAPVEVRPRQDDLHKSVRVLRGRYSGKTYQGMISPSTSSMMIMKVSAVP